MTTTGAELHVYKPGSTEPDLVIDGDDFTFSFSERVGRRKNTGSVALQNDHGQYTGEITSGDRLEFIIDPGQSFYDEIDDWGDPSTEWGSFIWPGERRVWTAMARTDRIDREAYSRATMNIECEDFAMGVMAKRTIHESYRDQTVIGILRRLIARNAEELTLSAQRRGNLLETTSVAFGGETLFDAFDEIVSRSDCVVRTHGTHIHVQPFELPDPKFSIDARRDFETTTTSHDDDGLVNVVRVTGPREPILDEEATLEKQRRYWTVHPDSYTHFQVPTRKSEIDRIELWVRSISDSSLTLRLQRDDDGQPVNSNDESSDIARRTLSNEFLADDGWTEFIMPDHTLPEPNPRIILETEDDAQQIGINSDGRVTRKVYFPLPVTALTQDTQSIREYRRRSKSLTMDDADASAARDRSRAELRRHSSPDEFVECEAESYRMHMLRPGEVVEFTYPRDGISGNYMLIERADAFEGAQIDTTLTFQGMGSY